uniref:hypothetical protein n=1 Tax=Alistipes shahii TaxID=328814 RepID=UPI003AAE1FC0
RQIKPLRQLAKRFYLPRDKRNGQKRFFPRPEPETIPLSAFTRERLRLLKRNSYLCGLVSR